MVVGRVLKAGYSYRFGSQKEQSFCGMLPTLGHHSQLTTVPGFRKLPTHPGSPGY
jgi:hypothetical protein